MLTYVANPCAFVVNCTYKDTLGVMLRDKMVCGINDTATQKHLLVEPKLTFQTAPEIARSPESDTQRERVEDATHPGGDISSGSPCSR